MAVTLKSPEDIQAMREAGKLAAEVLAMLKEHVKPGVTTEDLDRLAYEHIVNVQKAIPANVGYRGFPKTVIKDGWHGDTSRMYFVGTPSVLAKRLVDTTFESMMRGIEAVRPGATLGDVGAAIQKHAEAAGFSVVREYCGHGIGKVYHDEPQVLHYGQPGQGLRLKPGMVFTIEPMVNAGRAGTTVQRDGWTVVTKDRSLSAQWEHMVAVTDDGYELLTPWPDGTGAYEAP